jgi:hypothetical protein
MAFAIKYTSSFDVVERPQMVSATYLLTFSKEGYTGSPIELKVFGSNSVVAKISNDSLLGISSKKLDINILDDIDLSELQKAYPKQWKVEFFKTVGTTTTSEFVGWLMPTSSQTDYEDGLKNVRLEASDSLNNLKNDPFVDDSQFYYDGTKSIFEIVRLCLGKTALGLKINTINNTFANGNDSASTAEAMKQRYLDMDLFRGENEPLNTFNVLQDILNTESCRLYQEEGEWWIENLSEKKTGFVIARKYLADGSYISGGTLNLGISAVHNSNYQPFSGGISNVMPIKWAKVEHKLGKFKNRLQNKDLLTFAGTTFGNWTNNNVTPERVGDGTTGNAYGIKINGFGVDNEASDNQYVYQEIAFTNLTDALNFNIIFKGQAFIKDLDHGLIECELRIDVQSFEEQSIGYPTATNYFGLSESGEWVLSGSVKSNVIWEGGSENLSLENKDINGFSKKTVKNWDITSKRIGGISFTFGDPTGNRTLLKTGWQKAVTGVYIKIKLKKGVGELEPYPGETKASSVIYKNLSLSWVNSDTNLNLKEIHYKATQLDYAPNDETVNVIYGDYVDGSNLSALKNASGNLTSLWTSENSNSLMNFHKHGAMNILRNLGSTPKVYDGSIRGLIKYRHSVAMAGITNRGYITSFTFNYGSTEADVRIVEHAIGIVPTIKKTGILSDGTEITMVDDSPPSPIMGNSVGGGSTNNTPLSITSWIKQLLGGIQEQTNDKKDINVFWGDILSGDAFDFGTIVRRGDKVAIGSIDNNIELGNKENQTLVDVLGGKIKVGYNLLYDKSITDGEGDIVKQLGLDSDFQVDGRIEAVSGISVGSDGILITKELGAGGKPFGQVDAQNELRFVSPVVNVTNVLGVNQITGIGTNPITANAPIYFNQPIYVQPSNNPNSPITNAQFNVALAGGFAVSTTCKLLFNTNQSLAGAKTQGGYTTVTGDNILLNGQTTASENGVYVFDGTNWARNTANDTSAEIRLKGHLILNGTFASTQWVNNNSTDITVGTTAITYTQWSGAELDPIFTSHAAFNVTNAKIASWDLASTYGTHIGLYVDKSTTQNDIAGAKTFTTSIQSPIVKAGTDALNIQMFNYFGNSPRIASTGNTLEFFALQRFDWFTTGNIGQMRLNATGLRIGATTDPLFKLHVSGTAGFDGLISLGKTSDGIAMSSGTAGQFIRRSLVSNGFYNVNVNNWANIFVADISDIGTFYQAKITATENYLIKKTATNFGDSQIFDNGTFLAIGGTAAIDSSKFNVIGKIGATTARIGDNTNGINIANLAISSTGALGYNATTHAWSIATVEKLNLNSTRLALTGNLNVTGDVDITGKFKLNGSFGADHTFLKSNGTTQEFAPMTVGEIADIATYYASKQDAVLYGTFEGERGFKLFHDATKLDTAALFFANQDTGIVGIHYFGLDNSNNVTQHGLHIDGDGFVYHKKLNGSRARFLTTDDSLSGGGVTYQFAEPIYLNGNQISVRTASATQNGVLTKEDWSRFNAGTGSGGGVTYTLAYPLFFNGNQINVKTASATENGVLSSTKFSQFDAKLGNGSTVTSYLNYQTNSSIYFNYSAINSTASAYIAYIANTLMIGAQTELLIYSVDSKVNIQRNNYPTDGSMFTEVKMGNIMNNSILNFHGTNLNFKTNTTPTNGQKFCVQYDSTKNTFFFVPA